MENYLLGIDVGTSGSKVVLTGDEGAVKAVAMFEYPMYTPRPSWVEQHPEDWWRSTVKGIKKVVSETRINTERIAGIGLTGQMHGLVMMNGSGEVLRPCIMWNDQRSGRECREITEKVGERKALEYTGNPVLPGFTAPKIMWVKKNEPEVFGKTSRVLLPKDYVRYRLTGEYLSDVSDASGTSLFDVSQRRWSNQMLDILNIPRQWMPDVTESSTVSAVTAKQAEVETGLRSGTPVVGGAGDQAAQAVGAGIVQEGTASATIGTSGVVFAASEEYRSDPQGRLHSFCHAVPGMWHLMGVMLAAGGSFQWLRNSLCESEKRMAEESKRSAYEIMTEKAAEVSAGSEGMIFLPYLSGERTPYANPDARGVFFGISLRHNKAHFIRSVMEGVAYGLKDSLELMNAAGLKVEGIRVTGGGAVSPLWRRIIADVFNTEIQVIKTPEGAAFGAAILAGVGVEVFENAVNACKNIIVTSDVQSPGPDSRIYADFYTEYRALYQNLIERFSNSAKIVEKYFN